MSADSYILDNLNLACRNKQTKINSANNQPEAFLTKIYCKPIGLTRSKFDDEEKWLVKEWYKIRHYCPELLKVNADCWVKKSHKQ